MNCLGVAAFAALLWAASLHAQQSPGSAVYVAGEHFSLEQAIARKDLLSGVRIEHGANARELTRPVGDGAVGALADTPAVLAAGPRYCFGILKRFTI